mgnify:CR=1 FL=1
MTSNVKRSFLAHFGTKNKTMAKTEITTNNIFFIQILVGSELPIFVVVICGADSELDTLSVSAFCTSVESVVLIILTVAVSAAFDAETLSDFIFFLLVQTSKMNLMPE